MFELGISYRSGLLVLDAAGQLADAHTLRFASRSLAHPLRTHAVQRGKKRQRRELETQESQVSNIFERFSSEECRLAQADLHKADVSSLHPPDDENTLIHKLIGQYLAHEGYVETSKAFAADIRDQAAAPAGTGDAAAASDTVDGHE